MRRCHSFSCSDFTHDLPTACIFFLDGIDHPMFCVDPLIISSFYKLEDYCEFSCRFVTGKLVFFLNQIQDN